MENIMDEKLVQRYIDMLTGKINEISQENVLLKAKLSIAAEEINFLKQGGQGTEVKINQLSEEETVNANSNKAKKK